jgi:hypothetical protein
MVLYAQNWSIVSPLGVVHYTKKKDELFALKDAVLLTESKGAGATYHGVAVPIRTWKATMHGWVVTTHDKKDIHLMWQSRFQNRGGGSYHPEYRNKAEVARDLEMLVAPVESPQEPQNAEPLI